MTTCTRSLAGARGVAPLLTALLTAGSALLAPAAALGADAFPIPLVMKGVPADRGSWQIQMLEGPQLEEVRKQTGGKMTMCVTAAQALSHRQALAASETGCSARLVEDTATSAVIETTCKGSPPIKSRSAITVDGAHTYLVTHDQAADTGRPLHVKVRMSYLGPCSATDAAVSLDKDTPACQQARAQAAMLDPAKACAASGAQQAQCEAMLQQARARLDAMCR